MWTFPGGKRDPEDEEFSNLQISANKICAIRETFEEAGIMVFNSSYKIFEEDGWRQKL